MRIAELGDQVVGAFYRSGNELREKRHEECVEEEITLGSYVAAVHVDSIRKCLERVEGYADGEHKIQY